jgi:L-iditol 2-dehydrogenase
VKAARLFGPEDLRVEDITNPPQPQPGEVLLKIGAVGVCGSDLHMYRDGRIGDTAFTSPLTLGHEFAGQVVAVGDSTIHTFREGDHVAVDPACPCYECEWCERGDPNLCPYHTFYGVYPSGGALQEYMLVKARNCFVMPSGMSFEDGALLETLGVAIHAVDLAHLKIATSVAIIGCGPVGLLILRLLKLAGAAPIYAFDLLDWRVEKAKAWGADFAYQVKDDEAVSIIHEQTKGRGVDTVFEVAWADHTVRQAAEMAMPGGKVVLVGIPGDDGLSMQHSTARRKGLTIKLARRMKLTYPRAIQLASSGQVDLRDLVSHRFSLPETPTAFELNNTYAEGVNKIVVEVT